jgi:epoxyqueuosine reductase
MGRRSSFQLLRLETRVLRVQYKDVTPAEKTRWITEQARAMGFDSCGVAPVAGGEELERLTEWLERGYAGEMRYLHDPRRKSPEDVLPAARSVIVCALNYNTALPYSTEAAAIPSEDSGPRGWISRYAWGDDYHTVLGEKLDALTSAMRACFAEPFGARAYVDTGPVMERTAATRAGLGWLAKNTCLINPELGSWLFLGVILTTLDCAPSLQPGEPLPADLCGNCTLCIDACPTEALAEPYMLDARRCISYLTIELRGTIPEELRPGIGRMVFGCDICQDVCPWNRKAPASQLTAFLPRAISAERARDELDRDGMDSLFAPQLEWLASLTEDDFRRIFRGSAVRRTKWRGLVRNACVALGNSKIQLGSVAYSRVTDLLRRLADSGDEVIPEHARWALRRIAKNNAT